MDFCLIDGLCTAASSEGFWYGAAVGFILAFLLWCLAKLMFCRRSGCQSVRVADAEGGGFVITAQAVKSFVQWVAADYPELDLRLTKIKTLREGMALEIVFNVVPGAELAEIRQQFRERLFKEIEKRLGIVDQVKQINIEVDGYDARVDRIAKHNRGVKGTDSRRDDDSLIDA